MYLEDNESYHDQVVRDVESLIDGHGLHNVSVALIDIIAQRVERIAVNYQDAARAKKWERCIIPAKALERRALKEGL